MAVAATTFLVDVIIAFIWVENLTFTVLIINIVFNNSTEYSAASPVTMKRGGSGSRTAGQRACTTLIRRLAEVHATA